MADLTPVSLLADDDIPVRESLEMLLADVGWQPEMFACAQVFLIRPRPESPTCLLLDVRLPGLDGLELQKRITDQRTEMPIIFVTGRGDVPVTVRALKAGAVEFPAGPLLPEALLDAIEAAFELSRAALDAQATLQELRNRHRSLTGRERQVMALVVRGRLNKQVGGDLDISEITVKAHRGRVMRKMGAKSLADLVHMATRLGLV